MVSISCSRDVRLFCNLANVMFAFLRLFLSSSIVFLSSKTSV
ncbi:unnamed protein product [Schistosoma margrebowiei]|uniref:Uncharacterized protein n=1 Tax=Schistosoma margrebowiei TaxID=48269 RepID=A0A3P8A8T9_9TREM|nr:unnamed protein product [Schistosoma margrebowiei]